MRGTPVSEGARAGRGGVTCAQARAIAAPRLRRQLSRRVLG